MPLKPDIELPSDGYERFYQNEDTPSFLKNLGFNLFSVANNHMFDWGKEGFLRVKEVFGDACFGAGTYEDAYKIKVVEVKGKRLGFIALCYGARRGVFSDVHNHTGYGCAYINDLSVNHIIVEAKKELDYLFILPHAGIEYYDIPLPEIVAKYRDFIDWGADAVIASHPHCPQGWEKYNNKYIFYSLGNFFFNSKPNVDFVANKPHWYEGLSVVLELSDNGTEYKVINTRNTANTQISIDLALDRHIHNNYLCDLLLDRNAYDKYLYTLVSNHSRVIVQTLTIGGLIASFKNFVVVCIKALYYILSGQKATKYQSYKSHLNSDYSKSILRRFIVRNNI